MSRDEQLIFETILAQTGKIAALDTTMEALDLDSLEFLELFLQIENATGVRLPAAIIQTINTVADIKAAIEAMRVPVSA